MKKQILHILPLLSVVAVMAQTPSKKDQAVFENYKPGYYENSILKGIESYESTTKAPVEQPKKFKLDFNGYAIPNDPSKYTSQWYNDPVSQGNTGTCWCFSATSFYESEVYRLTKQKIKLSEAYAVYWQYVERAINFVKERGNMTLGEGSESNAVTAMYKKYGALPYSEYSGLKPGQSFLAHDKLFNEIDAYLKSVKAAGAWNEQEVISTVKSILNFHMGEPPTKIIVNGKSITPKEYLKDIVKINMDDYIEVMSLMSEPFFKKAEYKVSDNWWHNADYYNVPLADFMSTLKSAIRAGSTICIGGDVSEPGFDKTAQAAVVPTFDIPSEYIDDNARQFRFTNGTTTDDHGIHLVGYLEQNGKDWYLIKDSGSGSRNCGKDSKCFGYYFFSEDYVKLKMMTYTVHKDFAKDLLKKF
jgi:bleomycin hydrolase